MHLVRFGTFQRIGSAITTTLVCAAPWPKAFKAPQLSLKASFTQIQGHLNLSHKTPSPSPAISYSRLNVWIWFCLELLIKITSNTSISLSPNSIQLHKQVGSRWLHHWKISGFYSAWVKVAQNWAFVALYSNLSVSLLGGMIRNNTELHLAKSKMDLPKKINFSDEHVSPI